MMLLDVAQRDVGDGLETLIVRQDVFAERLLDTWPHDAVVIVQIACEFAAHITLFCLELCCIKSRRRDRQALQIQDPIPLKVRTRRLIHHGIV